MHPRAFRIYEFKSIVDSGICFLSRDGITVLAGQNEAGKTAILTALRDFDLPVGEMPTTQDYRPEEPSDANPRVAVEFDVDLDYVLSELSQDDSSIPQSAVDYFRKNPRVWITRTLETGQFSIEESVAKLWPATEAHTAAASAASATPSSGETGEISKAEAPEPPKILEPTEFADALRACWPTFVYFEAFRDSLPRQVDFKDVQAKPNAPSDAKVSSSVRDFVELAELDVDRVAALADNDKALGNYLSQKGAAITGDFLTYWKQKVDSEETVNLRVRQTRDSAGTLKLAFYVHDKTDQYPDQRSKGFLWFLSFYLKLAAAQKRYPDRPQILLIDEPGSYLHARAQTDVLHLLEDRIAKNDQVVYSTHSPYLIPADRLHRLRIVLKKSANGTKILDRLTHPDLRGAQFADSLSPVIAAIGIDISQSLTFKRHRNLFVEGITDLMYLTAWARLIQPELLEEFNIFPGMGATTIPLLASLFTGWGFPFIALLDNDDQGRNVREKLIRDLSVPASRLVQPKDAMTIEDLFSMENFRALLGTMDPSLTLNASERPSAAIRRLNIDKVLLARTYSESCDKLKLTKTSEESIRRVLSDISEAWKSLKASEPA